MPHRIGIPCPECGQKMRVLWKKDKRGGIRRQRICYACGGLKMLTVEMPVLVGPVDRIERRLVAAAIWQLIDALNLKDSIRLEDLVAE